MGEEAGRSYFLEIPVYFECDDSQAAYISRIREQYLASFQGLGPETLEAGEYEFGQKRAYTWVFNNVVGYIGLYNLGSQIRGWLHFVRANRVVRGAKSPIMPVDKLFELPDVVNESNSEILDKLLAELTRQAADHPKLRRRYVDLASLRAVGPFLDWRALLGRPAIQLQVGTGTPN